MTNVLKALTAIVNNIHDLLNLLSTSLGYGFTDKQLHFIVIGVIGILAFFLVDLAFKAIARYSVSIISFIYTFTVLVVIVFAIEIGQKITKRGNMEFADIVAGLWGFIVIFSAYVLIRLIVMGGIYLVKRLRNNKLH